VLRNTDIAGLFFFAGSLRDLQRPDCQVFSLILIVRNATFYVVALYFAIFKQVEQGLAAATAAAVAVVVVVVVIVVVVVVVVVVVR
jgi:hypothetical protein